MKRLFLHALAALLPVVVFAAAAPAPRALEAPPESAPACDALANLKLPSVDLLLIHWPTSSVPLKETVGALCQMKREGVARHIGVSNFDAGLIREAVKLST